MTVSSPNLESGWSPILLLNIRAKAVLFWTYVAQLEDAREGASLVPHDVDKAQDAAVITSKYDHPLSF